MIKIMKKGLESFSRRWLFTMAALAVIVTLIACSNDSSTSTGTSDTSPADAGNALSPIRVFEHDFNNQAITTTMTIADDQIAEAAVTLFIDGTPNDSKTLTASTDKFTLGTHQLQYMPASNACQPGGLYLISGTVAASDGSASHNYVNVVLYGWDTEGNPVTPWLTPFDAPSLDSRTSRANWTAGDPLDALGAWTHQVDYDHYIIPPEGCPMRTDVELTLTPVDERLGTKVYSYTVTETNVGGQITPQISASDPGAPPLSVATKQDPSQIRQLSFSGLDALRDAKAEVRLAFVLNDATERNWSAFPNASQPGIDLVSQIDITSGYPSVSLASHLARFFSGVSTRLTALGQSSDNMPRMYVKIEAKLSTPLAGGLQTDMPLVLVPNRIFETGRDDDANCPNAGLCCTLSSQMTAAGGTPDPAASYKLNVTFYSADAQPLLIARSILIPVSKVNH